MQTEGYATNTYHMREQQQKVQDMKQCRYTKKKIMTPDLIITSKLGGVSQHQPPDLIDNHSTD